MIKSLEINILKFCFALLLLISNSNEIEAQRQMRTINESWNFQKGEKFNTSGSLLNNNGWSNINIPHTWNNDAYVEKDYYRGTGLYRKMLYLSEKDEGKMQFLKFEAANQVAKVYVNGHFVGEHKGGYTAFTFNITPYCSYGQKNIIIVEVNNNSPEVPPVSADYTFFGGIYRDVWLISTSKQHLQLLNNGSFGLQLIYLVFTFGGEVTFKCKECTGFTF